MSAEAISIYTELLVNGEKKKFDKAFSLLNHILKLEYKNSTYWTQMGNFYNSKKVGTKE